MMPHRTVGGGGGGTRNITTINSSSSNLNSATTPHHHPNPSNSNSIGNNNEFVQRQILTEIQRFESVHPCIYRVYDLLEKLDDDQLANHIRQQVIAIEDAFVNSQEWTMSRAINEIRLGVIGSEDSCKNSLIHYFLTRNWNWEDAPEGGRFKKEVMVDGRSFLLLIRDEGSREPNLQFSQWLDALLIVFTLDSRKSFQYALELQQLVSQYRPLEADDVPVYLIGMKNMSAMNIQRLIGDEEAHRMAKARKMSAYFECPDGSSVQRMFNNVCQRVVQQRSAATRTASFIGGRNAVAAAAAANMQMIGGGGGAGNSFSTSQDGGPDPMLTSMTSASAFPAVISSGGGTARPSSYHHHQRSISVLPINNEHNSTPSHQNRRTPRFEDLPNPPPTNFRAHQQQQQHLPSHLSSSFAKANPNEPREERRRDSFDWQRRPIAVASPFAIPSSTPSVSAPLFAEMNRFHINNNNANGNSHSHPAEQVSPAYSQNSLLSSSHYQLSSNPLGAQHEHFNPALINAMNAAPAYSRSSSNMFLQHQHHPVGSGIPYNIGVGGRPCSDPTNQPPTAIGTLLPAADECFYDSAHLNHHQAHPLSTATSSSTLVVNNGNNGGQANLQPTPGSTPKTERKGKRISSIFRKDPPPVLTPDDRAAKTSAEVNMGIGRAIPIKQGNLYKRSKNGLNKEWKKKYVCLYPDGRICYHQNLKDYMDKDSRAKEIYLGLATVRTSDRHKPKGGGGGGNNRHSLLPGQLQQQQCRQPQQQGVHDRSAGNAAELQSLNEAEDYLKSPTGELSEGISDGCGVDTAGTGGLVTSTSSSVLIGGGEKEKPGSSGGKKEKQKEKKKRAKRTGSGVKNEEDEESCEFEIVSCDQKRWEFSAPSAEERDQWVTSIEHEIEKCLQQQLSLKDQQQLNGSRNGPFAGGGGPSGSSHVNGNAERRRATIQALRHIEGNDRCADCGALQPQWASINIGTLICIECSGIHRKLGSHISKVRSLELDDWPPEHLVVMQAIGNSLANQIWEHNASARDRPGPEAPQEQKERWIRMKYQEKLFLPPIPVDRTLSQQLVNAVLARNIQQLLMVLPRCTKSDMNAPIGGQNDRRTAVHLACGIGAPEILQLLIWYNADIYALDEQGRSTLWHAQVNGASECAAILMQAGLRPSADEDAGGGANTNGGRNNANNSTEQRL